MSDPVPFTTLLAIGALSLVPFLFMASTCFVKLAFVFSVLRNAIGTGQVPSGMVITALAAILSLYVMWPVATQMVAAATPAAARVDPEAPLSAGSRAPLWEALQAGKEPLRAFLQRNAGDAERALFVDLAQGAAKRAGAEAATDRDLLVVLPAFLITELKEAFQIGFFVFLPFLVIDLVVANLLMALGLHSLSAVSFAMPFKLLLFVMVDGFSVLSRALISGYA